MPGPPAALPRRPDLVRVHVWRLVARSPRASATHCLRCQHRGEQEVRSRRCLLERCPGEGITTPGSLSSPPGAEPSAGALAVAARACCSPMLPLPAWCAGLHTRLLARSHALCPALLSPLRYAQLRLATPSPRCGPRATGRTRSGRPGRRVWKATRCSVYRGHHMRSQQAPPSPVPHARATPRPSRLMQPGPARPLRGSRSAALLALCAPSLRERCTLTACPAI